jgi:lysozyme
MGVRAIDVSRWQGSIDWHAVRADGVPAAWIKVGGADGSYYRDSKAAANLSGAPAAGVEFGTYYFCSPARGDAIAQARHAVQCGHGQGRLEPAADVESNPNGLSQAEIDAWCTDFCAEVQRLTGRESLIYTYSSAGLVGYTAAAPRHCRLWVANYGGNAPSPRPPGFSPRLPPAWSEWSVWQFNSTTRVPGIPGNTVDQNVITDAYWHEIINQPMTGEEDDMPLTDDDLNKIVERLRPVIREETRPRIIDHNGEQGVIVASDRGFVWVHIPGDAKDVLYWANVTGLHSTITDASSPELTAQIDHLPRAGEIDLTGVELDGAKVDLTDEAVQRVATATADEEHRRSAE